MDLRAGLVFISHTLLYLSYFIYPCFLCVPTIGCNGRAVRQAEATKNPWEESVDRFWEYIAKLGQNADGVVENLKASQLSRELE